MVVEPVQLKMIDARDGNNCHRYQELGGGRGNPSRKHPPHPSLPPFHGCFERGAGCMLHE